MRQDIFRVFIGVLITGVAPVCAENLSVARIQTTPAALVRQALANNPELKFYVAEIAAAKVTLKAAGTIRNPELNTQAGYKRARDNFGGPSGEGGAWSVSINQTFEYPGRIALRKAIAKGDIDLAQLHLQQFRLTLAARVRTLAYSISIAEERSIAAREVADRFQALSDVLAQRPPAGTTPLLETRIIDANTLNFRRQQLEAVLAAKTAVAELNQLCGRRPADAALQVRAGELNLLEMSLQTLVDAARANAFDIRIRQREFAQQGFKVALARNERFPAIAIGPYYLQENAVEKEHQAGIGISLPLPLWDRNIGNIETSKARQEQAQASLLVTQREVERRVTQSAATFQMEREQIANWQVDTVAKFREAAELADRNYRLGAVALPVYVETQKQYLEIVGALHEMKRDALQAAQELEILTSLRLYREEERP
ncbi:MAG TPA: TolC family protein [Candidatus Udaeobacter sp.]|jgi:cobalt-zinc-cadmium efflux system outer membrane protein|nr:TolC family protein [Candidatus Udaeobacter sp.]